jgi:hypothetical protein
MPHVDIEKRKKYQARYMKEVWYPKNKEKHISYVKRNKQRVTEFIEKYKKERSCMDCGFSGKDYPYVLDFDHLNVGTSKAFTIGSWSHSVLSVVAIEREIEKCELVCANCHRIRTFSKKRLKSS